MALTTIDTTDPQYQQLLNGLGTLRTVLAPRVEMLLSLRTPEEQMQWLQRDPLLRRAIKLAQALMDVLELEVEE